MRVTKSIKIEKPKSNTRVYYTPCETTNPHDMVTIVHNGVAYTSDFRDYEHFVLSNPRLKDRNDLPM